MTNRAGSTIPLVDLREQYSRIEREIQAAILQTINSSQFIGGTELDLFEQEFSQYCGATGCVGVANGTDALSLALAAMEVRAGDEVILPVNTFIATAEAVSSVGAVPVFVDVDPTTLQIDPACFARAATPRTRAVIVVHLYGSMADMSTLREVAARNSLAIIEDAAQAHGASSGAKRAGAWGDLACFSFFPGKNLGAYGDGGAVVGRDPELLERVRQLANHGRMKGEKYLHSTIGRNSRLDNLQAAILRVKLKHLDDWNSSRRRHADSYQRRLEVNEIPLVGVPLDCIPARHLLVVRVPERDRVRRDLKAAGIETGIHYPVPLHMQPAYEGMYPGGSFPVAERAASEILSLPLYPELTEEQIDRVCHELARAI